MKRQNCPTVLQMEAVECGAASLAMILGHYGRFVPLAELRYDCGVSRDGSKAVNLLKAARKYGFEAKGYRKDLDDLKDLALPFIVFWNFNHFLVVEGFGKNEVFLNDPACGRRRVSREEFGSSYTGVSLVFSPTKEFRKGGTKPQLFASLSRRLKGSHKAIAFGVAAGLLLILPNLAIPVFTQVFVDNVLVRGLQDWLKPLLIGMGICAVLTGGLKIVELATLRRLKAKLAIILSEDYLSRVLRLPIGFYAQRFAGEIGNRIALNDQLAEAIAGPLLRSAIDIAVVLVFGSVMLAYDWMLTSVALLLALLNFVALRLVNKMTTDANLRMGMEYGKATGVSIAGLQAIETLKASGLEGDFFARWAGYYAKAMTTQQEIGTRGQILSVLSPFLNTLTTMVILVLGGWRVMDGHLSIGMLVAYQSLMGNFLTPLGRILAFGQTLPALGANLTRLDDILINDPDPETLPERGEIPESGEMVRLSGEIELKNLSFGYSRLEAPLIENFDLTLKPGARVAFVGASGSGKSTLAKLIAGLYEPWSGEILFDGKPRKEIPRPVLNGAISMVDQDLFLFSGPVRDNLSLWDRTVSEDDLIKACQDADIHDVLADLPGSYGCELLEGASNLSGGQRQRLEIARALSKNPSILVLDEATSALDTKSEAVVDRNIRKRGCTCVIVAHRLSTIRDCDEIVVFEQGKAVQRGTFDALRSADGPFKRLIDSETAGEKA